MADRRGGVLADQLVLAVAFWGATGIAALLGAANFGTALTFGQLAFAAALVFVILRD
jgi:hypothetical protein